MGKIGKFPATTPLKGILNFFLHVWPIYWKWGEDPETELEKERERDIIGQASKALRWAKEGFHYSWYKERE